MNLKRANGYKLFPFRSVSIFFKYLRKTVFFSVESAISFPPYLTIVFLW